jgi:molybdenum cofactor cytidylyltransferase
MPNMTALILLTAGYSQRFGMPKALATIGKRTIIESTQHMLIDSLVDEIVVVIGASCEKIKPFILNHKKLKVVYNKSYNLGQTSSFKAGLEICSKQCDGFLLLPVDFPFVCKETIDFLITQFHEKSALILIPAYYGRLGHPPVFSASLRNEFLDLNNNEGCNVIANRHPNEVQILSVEDPAVFEGFNTPEEWDVLRSKFDPDY